jgi:hypothetical protein
LLLGLLLVVVAGSVGWAAARALEPEAAPPAVIRLPTPAPSAAPTTIIDPLLPKRPVHLDSAPRAAVDGDWVTARPSFQYSRPPAERNGVSPCAMPGADASGLEVWTGLSRGRFIRPREGVFDAQGGFDLILHFHGDELAKRELIESGEKFVLYGLTLDADESYAQLFSGSGLYGSLIAQIEQLLTASHGSPVRARHVALSAWSAGYMAVMATLVQAEAKDVAGAVLIDGMHGPRGKLEHQLAPFVEYARRAATGERFLLVTHSSIDPPNFASTTESAHYLLSALGAKPIPVRRDDGFGLELVEYFSRGDFHVRGYAGNDKADHCAQVTLLRSAYQALGRRFRGEKP